MKKINRYLAQYAVSHQNKTNKLIHIFFVPLIVMSVVGLLMCLGAFEVNGLSIDWALLVILAALGYYLHLSLKYFLIMSPFLLFLYALNAILSVSVDLFSFSLSVFIVSWIAQFIGHKIEGKKPSFLEDLLFLLIGPIWVFKSVLRLKD